jgi:hypothetical protein
MGGFMGFRKENIGMGREVQAMAKAKAKAKPYV